jgi:phosphatidylserine/phosphatidylglycerophosphate/cardiolipin synthase-like enzyme
MTRLFFLGIILHLGLNISAQIISIADIQGMTEVSPYNNKTVTTKGAVTGVFKDGYFIRESSESWSGIYIYDPGRNPMPRLGDTLLLTGLVIEYYSWTEIKNISDYEVVSTGNPEPVPVLLKAGDINESWESCLIRVENVVCSNANLGYGEWEVEDETGKLVVNDLGVAYLPDLGQEYEITGPLSFSFGAYKIEPRDLDDIKILSPVFFVSNPYASSIQKNELTLGWTTNVESSTELIWGYTPDLEMGNLKSPGLRTDHVITINNLEPAEVIYARAFSVLETDTAKSKIKAYITASESSGEIRVSFNRTPTNMSFTDRPDVFTNHLADTLIYYIGKAEKSLDIAFYDFTNHAPSSAGVDQGIENAIYKAVSEGVQVRLITDANVADAAPGGGETQIERMDISHNGIMHHKFLVVDHESVTNSWIVTGSTNPNFNNTILDFNNLVAIQDQSLARAYLLEFNEIWGSNTSESSLIESRSGSLKADDSPHEFIVNGSKVELYFSPSDQTTTQIAQAINGAVNSVDFAVMVFTENVLGDAVASAHKRGIDVRGIIDYVEFTGSEFNYLLSAGVDVLDYMNPDGSGWPEGPTLHHKFAIIDAESESARVITGSHNWTAAAEARNDENTLIIHDAAVAALFKLEFDRIVEWLKNPPVRPVAEDDLFELGNEDAIILEILDNDIYSGEVVLELLTEPQFGSYSITENQSIEYFPDPGFNNDTLVYIIRLASYPQFSDTASVTIRLKPTGVDLIEETSAFSIYPGFTTAFVR